MTKVINKFISIISNFFQKHKDTILSGIIGIIFLIFQITLFIICVAVILGILGGILEFIVDIFQDVDKNLPTEIIKIQSFLTEYPFVTFPIILIVFFLINKTISKRKSNVSELRSLFIFSIIGYLYYKLQTDKETIILVLNSIINVFINKLHFFVFPDGNIKDVYFNIDRTSIIVVMILLFIYWLNSRLVWLITLFIFELYLLFNNLDIVYSFLDDMPKKEYITILKGLPALILSAPFVLAVWIFRDNDKVDDVNNRQKELQLKERELELRERELEFEKKKYEEVSKEKRNI